MSIKYECPCGAVLKIKEDLAGTHGKCPNCKAKFTVPQPVATGQSAAATAGPSNGAAPQVAAQKPAKPLAPTPTKPAVLEDDSSEMDLDGGPVAAESKPTELKPAKGASAKPTAPASSKKDVPAKEPAKPGKPSAGKTPADDDDFDPVAFLNEDGPKKPGKLVTEPAAADGPKRWGASPKAASAATASESADQMISPSANARDLLAKSMQENRNKAASMPEANTGPSFDWAGLYEQIGGTKGLLGGVGGISVIVFLSWIMYRSMAGGLETPPLGYVTGQLTLDGKPVPGALVVLTPTESSMKRPGKKELPVRSSSGICDDQGYFSMMYTEDVAGAAAGKSYVTVEDLPGTPPHLIPADYQQRSIQHPFEVVEGSNEDLKVELKMTPTKAPPASKGKKAK